MQDLDAVRGDQREVGQVLVGQHYHVAGGQFVALGHVGVGDLLAVQGAEPAELDPGPVLAVDLAEGDVTLLGRRVELHRDHDQAERDGPRPICCAWSSPTRLAPLRPQCHCTRRPVYEHATGPSARQSGDARGRAPTSGLVDHSPPTQSPGIGGGFPAQFVDARRRAWPRCGLDPPELQVRLPGLGLGDPAHPSRLMTQCSRIARTVYSRLSPHEPGRPAVVPGLNVNWLAVHPVHAAAGLPARRSARRVARSSRITWLAAAGWRKAGSTIGDPG